MDILFNSHYLGREITGLGRYTRQLHSCLSGENVIYVQVPAILYRYRYLRFFAIFFWELFGPSLLRLRYPDAVHISPSFSCGILASEHDIVVVHDLAFIDYPDTYSALERLYLRFNIYLLKKSKCRIVTPSLYVKNQLSDHLGICAARILTISPYSDFVNLEVVKTKYFVLLSNAHPRKNIANVVDAFMLSSAIDLGYCLKLVGNFDFLIKSKSEFITVIKGLSDQELQSLLSQSSALLIFSYSEGFGYPVIEAASLGVPSLTSNVTSLKELMGNIDGTATCLTVNDIKNKINLFLTDEAYRERLCKYSQELNERYSKINFESNWMSVINE